MLFFRPNYDLIYLVNKDSISIIISSKSISQETVSGYVLRLFQDDKIDKIDKEISSSYSNYLSNIADTKVPAKLAVKVNSILKER
ncbi:hypothetical protein [Shewanella woodyi]|uniref:hypothetical protein n=1 Tax=Shewanella woodyi TaxID=60961 RepID=UPI0007F8C981|nr:hypothetical protein [Shewanella woodyi]